MKAANDKLLKHLCGQAPVHPKMGIFFDTTDIMVDDYLGLFKALPIFPMENPPFEKSIVIFFFDPLGMSKMGIRYYPLFLWSITIHYGSFFQPEKWHDTGKLNAAQEGSQSYQKRLG